MVLVCSDMFIMERMVVATLIESDVTGQRHTKAYERHLLSDDLEPSMLTVTQKYC